MTESNLENMMEYAIYFYQWYRLVDNILVDDEHIVLNRVYLLENMN